jgi:hypothetical protein
MKLCHISNLEGWSKTSIKVLINLATYKGLSNSNYTGRLLTKAVSKFLLKIII